MAKKNSSDDINRINAKAINSLKDYKELLEEIRGIEQDITNSKQQSLELDKEIKDIEEDIKKLEKDSSKEGQKKLKQLQKDLLIRQMTKKMMSDGIGDLETQLMIYQKILKNTSAIGASWRTIGQQIKSAGSLAKQMGTDALKAQGVFKDVVGWQKEINAASKAMGFAGRQAEGFSNNLQRASVYTNQLGVDAGKLAKMQSSYSEQIGRSVQLSEKGLAAMAAMAEGTMLGSEGAAEMAAAMDQFGISVVGASNIVEDMTNSAQKMGVNSVKVTKNLLTNMRLANKVHFKGGVESMVRLASEAARMRLDLEGIAGTADKAFRPEGANELAAKLQVMGGEFAKLADPFQLMFKARNDFEGFAKDIGNATKEFATFNSESGEFEISALQMDRMKEIADATGISADKLAEMGRTAALMDKIEMETNLVGDDAAFAASVAQFNKATKEYEITVDGQTKSINQLSAQQIKELREEKASLEERAKTAQTFDETWENLKNTLKSLLLPVMQGLQKALKGPIQGLMEKFTDKNGLFKKLFNWGEKLGHGIIKFGEFVKPLTDGLISFIDNNPLTSIIGGLGLFTVGKWVANGVALGVGFNSVASAGGGGGLMDIMGLGKRSKFKGSSFSGKKNMIRKAGGASALRSSMGKRAMKSGAKAGGKGLLKAGGKGLMKGLGKSLLKKIPIIGAIAGLGFAGSRLMDGDVIGALMEAGSGIASIIPGIGTAASLGLDAAIAARDVYKDSNGSSGNGLFNRPMTKYDDVIMRNGQAPIAINSADDIMSVKKDGPVDKALGNAKTSSGGGSTNMTFSPITINGKIELVGGGSNSEIILDDPLLMRDLSRVIQEEVRKAIGGGKLNPNPI